MLKTYGRDAEAFVGHVETNTLAGKFHAFLIGNGGHSGRSGWLGRLSTTACEISSLVMRLAALFRCVEEADRRLRSVITHRYARRG